MKKVVILFLMLLPTLSFSSKILSHNIYERTDRVDIMITFDTPYEGTLYQTEQNTHIKLTLQGATVEEPITKNLSNTYLTGLTITPIGDHAEIILNTPSQTVLAASKTIDGYGLRLRLNKKVATSSSASTFTTTNDSLPTQKRNSIELSTNYYIAIAVLIFAVIILYFLRNRVSISKESGSWLMGSNSSSSLKNNVNVVFQKPLDSNNKVVLMEFEKRRYLAIIGSSNMLLDTFTADNKPIKTQEQFNKMLLKNSEKLDEFMNLNNQLDSYKEKAGHI